MTEYLDINPAKFPAALIEMLAELNAKQNGLETLLIDFLASVSNKPHQ